MPAAYLHGAEVLQQSSGPVAISTVDSSTIALVCTCPTHRLPVANRKLNTLFMVASQVDAGNFIGPEVAGFTGPNAIKAAFDQGGAKFIVVNVFDSATHKTAIAAEVAILTAAGTVALAHKEVLPGYLVKNALDTITYVDGTDYTLDPITGIITRIAAGAILAAATLHVTYSYADPSLVTAADIIGTVGVGAVKTGWQLMLDAAGTFGISPHTLICPVYATQNTVAVEMIAKADTLKGHALIDAPIGTTRDNAIAGRGPAGTINFNTSDPRAILCYPHWQVANAAGVVELRPHSQYLAGVWANVDLNEGFWVSPSNHEVKGVLGREFPLSSQANDPNADINLLNAAGIVTSSSFFGAGLRIWGNRSAAYPTSTDPSNFFCVQRSLDIIHESLLRASLQFNDVALDYVKLDIIQQSVAAFLSTIQQKGGLVGAEVFWRKADNPITELAAGHATWAIHLMPPPPLERITFLSFTDINLLNNLFRPLAAS